MNDEAVIHLRTARSNYIAREHNEFSWPTMLGLLTIISDAIAAAPWWGDGEARVKVPRPGELWADFNDGRPDVVSIDSVDDDGTIWLWVMGRDYAGSYRLDEFLTRYQRAWVVPADVPDDQAAMHQTATENGRVPDLATLKWVKEWLEATENE